MAKKSNKAKRSAPARKKKGMFGGFLSPPPSCQFCPQRLPYAACPGAFVYKRGKISPFFTRGQGLWRPKFLSPTWLNHFHFPLSAPLTLLSSRRRRHTPCRYSRGSRSSSGLHYCQTQRRLMRGLDPFLRVAGAIPWTSEYAISGEVHCTGA